MTQTRTTRPLWLFLLLPGAAMLLGWGLRGYIGGGPYGAMIPGCFVAACLSLMLGHEPRFAAMFAVFAAVAIGLGGEMTYGQTIGLAMAPETRAWGLLGLTLKGAVWGFLGGAVLGLGLDHRRYPRATLVAGLALSVAAFYVGWRLINVPKLIYFSDPVNKPRQESWAGLSFAAIALLAWFYAKRDRSRPFLAGRFALWGIAGGGLGFGGGALWQVYGPLLPVPQRWFGWWKMMEFTFGLLLGMGWGACAYANRAHLLEEETAPEPEAAEPRQALLPEFAATAALLLLVYMGSPGLTAAMTALHDGASGFSAALFHDAARMADNLVVIGALLVVVALFRPQWAWQVAVSVTFCHAVLDFVEDLPDENGIPVGRAVQAAVLIAATGAMVVGVAATARGRRPIPRLFMLLLWSCVGVALVKSFLHARILWPEPEALAQAGGRLGLVVSVMPAQLVVVAVFLLSAVATTWAALRAGRVDGAG